MGTEWEWEREMGMEWEWEREMGMELEMGMGNGNGMGTVDGKWEWEMLFYYSVKQKCYTCSVRGLSQGSRGGGTEGAQREH